MYQGQLCIHVYVQNMKFLWSKLLLEQLYTDDTDNNDNNTSWTKHDCIGKNSTLFKVTVTYQHFPNFIPNTGYKDSVIRLLVPLFYFSPLYYRPFLLIFRVTKKAPSLKGLPRHACILHVSGGLQTLCSETDGILRTDHRSNSGYRYYQ